jgi:SAM-dependent methyltransferase
MRSSSDEAGRMPWRRGPSGELSADEARILHGSSFGTAAEAYAEHRPDYAEAAVRWALEPVADREPLRVLDLGAGTGKLTAALLRLGAEVTAVEPDPAMLAQLRQIFPGVRAQSGSAEAVPVGDGAVDAVVAGQAAHWFDLDRALPEIARAVSPGGVFAGLWNVDDDRVDWVAGLKDVSEDQASAPLSRWRERADAYLGGLDAAEDSQFLPSERAEFEHGLRRTADTLTATIATHSALLVRDRPDRDRLLAEIRDYLGSRPETAAGEFTLPMITCVVRAIRDAG